MSDKSLEATAYHEAGHVVAHLLLDREIESVTIKPSEEYHGLTSYADSLRPGRKEDESLKAGNIEARERWRKLLELEAIKTAAGNEAERFYLKSRVIEGAYKDWTAICHLLELLCDGFEEVSAYHALIVARTRNLILEMYAWIRVEAIAAALLERETLTGAEAEAIFNSAISSLDGQRSAEIRQEILDYKRDFPLDLSEWKWTPEMADDQCGEG